MIVPRDRLVGWTALVVLPLGALAAAYGGAVPLILTVVALFCAMVLADALFALGSLEGIGISVPKVIRMFKDRPAQCELEIKNDSQKARELRLALALPAELRSEREDICTLLPAGTLLSKVAWSCTPSKRGNYAIDACYLETGSPLGLWSVRARASVNGEARVYPNLLKERRAAAALFLNRGAFGLHAQRQVGKGREFEKIRDYLPGDSYDEIHWKATAKRNRPVTKVFQIERTQEVYVIIDASRLSARQPDGARPNPAASTSASPAQGTAIVKDSETLQDTLLERFITAGLILGAAAERQGDLFGLLAFDDRVRSFVRAKNGKAHYATCRDALYTLHPQPVSPDFDELCSFIRLRLRRRALLIFLTSLEDPILAESFSRNMDLICRQHLILVNMMQPPGVGPLFAKPGAANIDSIYQGLGGQILWSKLRELERALSHHGVRFSLVENEKLSAQLITQYLGVKRRQVL